jgi:hypothetical protein
MLPAVTAPWASTVGLLVVERTPSEVAPAPPMQAPVTVRAPLLMRTPGEPVPPMASPFRVTVAVDTVIWMAGLVPAPPPPPVALPLTMRVTGP